MAESNVSEKVCHLFLLSDPDYAPLIDHRLPISLGLRYNGQLVETVPELAYRDHLEIVVSYANRNEGVGLLGVAGVFVRFQSRIYSLRPTGDPYFFLPIELPRHVHFELERLAQETSLPNPLGPSDFGMAVG